METARKKMQRRAFNKLISGSLISIPLSKILAGLRWPAQVILGTLEMASKGLLAAPSGNSQRSQVPQDPIAKLAQVVSTTMFTGDEPDPNHERLWNVDGYIQKSGGIPTPSETQNVVIIGGGLSGLISGYYLQNLKPLILEQASRFGGNAKGETVGSNVYSLGPAYISIPEANSPSMNMLNQIGALRYAKIESPQDKSVFLKNKFIPRFWLGQHENPQVYQQWLLLLKNYEQNSQKMTRSLNQISMKAWIQAYFPQITTALYEYLEFYSWSSFAATLSEVAAGEFLSWQASEQHGVMVFPGGNSLITQSLFQFLKHKLGPTQLRTQNMVLKVIPNNGYVDIVVEESLYKLKTIRAKYAIMAAPKFVARKMVSSIPVAQLKMMEKIEYRSYIVGNITLRKNIPSKGFDLYCLNGSIPMEPSPTKMMSQGFTDMIFANWAQNDKSSTTTLTLYKAFPYQGARQFLLNPIAHDKHKDFMLKEVQRYFPELGITINDIAAVKVTLWGHAVPICQAGLAYSKELELASAPIGNLFFANQDNTISPSYESSENAALMAALAINQKIKNTR